MGEVDTKPINSVQAALSLFGEKSDRIKDRTSNSDEFDGDEELQGLLKGLSNLKVQMEAKEFANKQAILKLENYEKQTNELSSLLTISELEKEIYMNECKEAGAKIHELESKINEITDQLSEITKTREQVSRLENELISANDELLQMEASLADSENTKAEALGQTRTLEMELEMESKTNEEVGILLSEKEAELELKTRKLKEIEETLEVMRKEMEMSKLELDEKEDEKSSNPDFEKLKNELEKVKTELEEISKKEIEAQIEIALLKSEIHKGRSKIAEVEAVEERLKGENCSLYIAVKQLGLEVEATKNENKMLRKLENESDETIIRMSKEELERLKSDLENANSKIGELRARAEQATSRAEVAEKGKAELEDRITRWRERRERRKSAIAALREDLIPEESTSYGYGQRASSSNVNKAYEPLGKVLNMKF